MATAGSLKALRRAAQAQVRAADHTSAQAGLLPVQRFAMLSDPRTLRDGFKPSGELVVAARVSGDRGQRVPGRDRRRASPPLPDALKASAQAAQRRRGRGHRRVVRLHVGADAQFLRPDGRAAVRQQWRAGLERGRQSRAAAPTSSASAAAPPTRGRSNASRRCGARADAQFRSTEQQLEEELQQTEEPSPSCRPLTRAAARRILSPEAGAAPSSASRQEKLRIRKELRADEGAASTRTSRRWACR